ncbi:hypothetical protein POM88_020862 [Heracleum sosnowskyi]|uniref:RNase H type-1 domain-containing protein n=1 Tax=Heracleum sosnowskyi TaxID=360622 RepID=A0AAD8IEQ7_9APIA|nr:hypothetical protein POM88_020862 [Heracleum sosnowskyi]
MVSVKFIGRVGRCNRVKELWEEIGCAELTNNAGADSLIDLIASWKRVDVKKKKLAIFLAWVLWTERNLKIFENKFTPNAISLARVFRMATEHNEYANRKYIQPYRKPVSCSEKWEAPPMGTIKINNDVSHSQTGWVGLGVVARDSHESVLFAATTMVRAWWSVEVAEGKAMLMAMHLGHRHGLNNIIVESDSQVLVSRLSKTMIYSSKEGKNQCPNNIRVDDVLLKAHKDNYVKPCRQINL